MDRIIKKGTLLLLVALLLCGCGKQTREGKDIVADGTVQILNLDGLESYQIINDKIYFTTGRDVEIHVCDVAGKQTDTILPDADDELEDINVYLNENQGGLRAIGAKEKILYCARDSKNTILAIDTETKNSWVVGKSTMNVINACVGNQGVLLMGYNNSGNKTIEYLEFDGKEAKQLAVPAMITVIYAENQFLILCENEEQGMEFWEYNIADNSLENPIVLQIPECISDVTYAESEKSFYAFLIETGEFVRFQKENPKVYARFKVGNKRCNTYSLHCAGEKLSFIDSKTRKLCSIDPREYIQDNKPFKVLILENSEFSYFMGYQVEVEKLPWNEMALKILSQDEDYDFIVINSQMAEALSLRDGNMFLNLNSEKVNQFYENSFSYLSDAAHYQEEIWMLPVHVYLPALVYHEDNFAEAGFDKTDLATTEGIMNVAHSLYAKGENGKYELSAYSTNFPVKYVRNLERKGEVSLDTPVFQKALDSVISLNKDEAFWSYVNIDWANYSEDLNLDLPMAEIESRIWEKFLSTIYIKQEYGNVWDYQKYHTGEGFRAVAVPEIVPMDVNYVTADLLIANAASKRREEVNEFVDNLATELMASPEHFVSANRELYPATNLYDDLFVICENAELLYGVPEELLTDYYDYVWGKEKDKEKVIKGLEGKMRMYLCE